MTYLEFQESLNNDLPPAGLSDLLTGLWYDGKGDWEAAHNVAQAKEGSRDHDRLHAYLHRVEGDNWNANYWYRRAQAEMPPVALQMEWEMLVVEHLKSRA